jgi:hypothetical protein
MKAPDLFQSDPLSREVEGSGAEFGTDWQPLRSRLEAELEALRALAVKLVSRVVGFDGTVHKLSSFGALVSVSLVLIDECCCTLCRDIMAVDVVDVLELMPG